MAKLFWEGNGLDFELNYTTAYDVETDSTTVNITSGVFSLYGLKNFGTTGSGTVVIGGTSITFSWGGTTNGGTRYFSCAPSIPTVVVQHGGGGGIRTIPVNVSGQGKRYSVSQTKQDTVSVNATGTITSATVATLTYDLNGGAGDIPAKLVEVGKTATITAVTPNRVGQSFNGWATTETGVASYHAGDVITVNEDITLYADWDILSAVLSLMADAAANVIVTRTETIEGTVGILSDGDAVYFGDHIRVDYSLDAGYDLGTHTLNGEEIVSPSEVVCDGSAIVIVVRATLHKYRISSSNVLMVSRAASPYGGATGIIPQDSVLYYGDVLRINGSVEAGYKVVSISINGVDYTPESRITVTEDLVVVVVISANATAHIFHSNAWRTYLVNIYVRGAWRYHQPMIYTNGEWKRYF